MSRVLMVSNRLPTTVVSTDDGFEVTASTGGVATGLGKIHRERGALWIGTAGVTTDQLDPADWERMTARLAQDDLVVVPISDIETERYYEGFANGFVWPLLHSQTGRPPLESDDWAEYQRINQRFADAIVEHYRDGDQIWIHDFHLLLVPSLVRERLPAAAIGFFLHVPFPTADIFRTLPGRRELLRGLLGADLIGFHTASYLRFFSVAVAELLGERTEIDGVIVGGRLVRLGVFPIGIDPDEFARLAGEPVVRELVAEIRGNGQSKLMVGVDRLDYTKGVPRRLLAFERLLERHPELHERVRLLNLSVPTRETVPAYQEFRRSVDRLVGRINGRFSTPRWTPIHYMFRAVDRPSVVALYAAADVMLVTPIRDGMNLVAKEFVASRVDGDGVLLLSEFAGAAADLSEAVIVNPFEVDQMSENMADALAMPEAERRTRMAALRARVSEYDGDWWAQTFLDALRAAAAAAGTGPRQGPAALEAALIGLRAAPHRILLLDYDGTLTPIVADPDEAVPDQSLRDLLSALAADPRNEVHIVSGRSGDFLERWLGDMDLHLHAEHGAASRAPGAAWRRLEVNVDWMDRVARVLDSFTRVTPGAFTETKTYGLCWHWRKAHAGAARTATELALHLSQVLQHTGADVLVGNRVVEVRAQGINKGGVARLLALKVPDDAAWLAAGDDTTDEDLFRVLPERAISIRVGGGPTAARFGVAAPAALRQILAGLDRA